MLGYNELLNEKCTYKHYVSKNKYNEKEYSVEEQIDCFKSFDFSNFTNLNQQDINLTKRIFIKNDFEPNAFDLVDGQEIKQIIPVKGLVVPIIGWEIIV